MNPENHLPDDTCPVCGSVQFHASGVPLRMDEILERWRNEAVIEFSSQVLEHYGHGVTTLHTCENCGFGIFLPVFTATPQFYAEVSKHEYYNNYKWEFIHALSDIARFKIRLARFKIRLERFIN